MIIPGPRPKEIKTFAANRTNQGQKKIFPEVGRMAEVEFIVKILSGIKLQRK